MNLPSDTYFCTIHKFLVDTEEVACHGLRTARVNKIPSPKCDIRAVTISERKIPSETARQWGQRVMQEQKERT